MQNIIIIGNSGAAREGYWIFQDMLQADPSLAQQYRFKGFLSWQGYVGDLKGLACHNLGEATYYTFSSNDHFIIGIGKPELRRDVFQFFKAQGAKFFTLCHPEASISPTAQIGEGNIFQVGCTVFCDSILGNANYLNGAVNISHDVYIGDFNFLGPFTIMLGCSKLGNTNTIAARCTILSKSKIGNNNIIAPSSVIYKGCGNNARMIGNPALKIANYNVN